MLTYPQISSILVNIKNRSEVVPEYVGGIFELEDFTEKRQSTPNYFLSPPLMLNGLVWRLKVYPNGNGCSKGSFISVFLCMEEVMFLFIL